MKSRFILFGIIASLLTLSSCAFHSGMMTGNANLSGDNFEILSIESGTSKTTHVFGIGGLKHQALVFEAKKNMYRSSSLKKGQAYANVSVDFKRSTYFFVNTTIVTVTADLVQFGSDPDTTLQQGFNQFLNPKNSTSIHMTGDYINSGYFQSDQIAYIYKSKSFIPVRVINGIENPDGKYNVTYLPPSTKNERFIERSDLYFIEEPTSFPNHDYHIGDQVQFLNSNNILQNGIISAIGTDNAIVKSGSSIYTIDIFKLDFFEFTPEENSEE